jgi:hypothetical protein
MQFTSEDRLTIGPAMRFLFLTTMLLALVAAAQGQAANKPLFPPPSEPNLKDGSKDGKDEPRFGSPEAEMRSKLEIKEEKKKYDEHLARAKEISELAGQISKSFATNKSLSADDQKRFERLEKLTKRIRNDAGGENKADAELKDIPAGMDQTLKKISDMADELQKLVENTPRNVISAAVIDEANQLLTLIQLVRATSR